MILATLTVFLASLVGALLIGLSLGLMGSGGSILTVPVLVYIVGQHEKVAVAGSLAVVGAISLVASSALRPTRSRVLGQRRSVRCAGHVRRLRRSLRQRRRSAAARS